MKQLFFIAAGTQGAKLINGEHQPFIKVGNKTNIEHVVNAAQGCNLIDNIIIWGDKEKLTTTLSENLQQGTTIQLFEEQNTIIDSLFYCYFCQFSHPEVKEIIDNWQGLDNLPWLRLQKIIEPTWINLVVCDTPFLTSKDLEIILSDVQSMRCEPLDFLTGRSTQHSVNNVLNQIPDSLIEQSSVKNFYSYYYKDKPHDLIVNSYFGGLPLTVDLAFWKLTKNILENRTIIKGGKKDWKKIRKNLQMCIQYARQKFKSKKLDSMLFLIRSYRYIVSNKQTKSKKLNDLTLIYKHLDNLCGYKLRYVISDSFGAAFDIDTQTELDFAKKNHDQIQKITQAELNVRD